MNAPANFAPMMADVANRLLGEPSQHNKNEVRWGNKGSLSVDLEKGTWFDHEADMGGGVLDLIRRERGCDKGAALDWLKGEGLLRDDSPAAAPIFYDYRDETGAVRYRVERRGKRFLQHGPDGRGGFVCGKGCMDGVERLPYRLPELLASIGPVFVTEGEKDADRLASLGLVATCNSGGAEKFGADLARYFEGRRVVILQDNDKAGRDHARDVKRKLAGVAEGAILALPGLPAKGDVSDWLDAGGTVAGLLELGEAALDAPAHDPETGEILDDEHPQDDADPVDLWANHGAPELPQGLLPSAIETFARSHADTMGVDPAGLAMACLAVCAAAISDAIQLQVKRHDPTWRESARLWVGLVGSPSMKKTPIIAAAARPLKRIDSNLMRAYVEKRQAYDELTAKERKGVERPRQERRIISDATIEAAQEVLKDSPRGVLSMQDELSGWFGAMDKYSPGKGAQADRGFWLQAYNGGSYSLNRIGRGASYIPNCSIGLLGGIQPEPIRAIAGDTHDDGLVQRLIPVVLRPGKVGRDVPTDGTIAAYERLIERLELLQAGDAPLRFDEAARGVRERLEAEHLNLAASLETVSPKMAAHFGKHDGLFARLCVLWHCIEHNHGGRVPETISGDTAERVAEFMVRFIRPSAVAFYAGLLGMSAGHDRLLDLAAWILGAKVDEVKARDVQASGQAFRHVDADEVRKLCEKLEAFGWGAWAEPAPKSNKPRFVVNGRVHSLFAERGAAEAERRAKARELIRQTIGG